MHSKLTNGKCLYNSSSCPTMEDKGSRWYLHAGNKLYMDIPKVHAYLLLIDIGNTIAEYGQRTNIEICKVIFGSFPEEVDTVTGLKLPDAIQSIMKENRHMESLGIGHYATTYTLII